MIINEYQSSIAADINVTQNPQSIIDLSLRRFHHCLHFRPVRKGSIPWNIGCVGLALIIPKALLTIAFHSAVLSLSLSLSLSLCPSHYHSWFLSSLCMSLLALLDTVALTMQIASTVYWICPVLDPSLIHGYNSIRVCGNVEYISRDYSNLTVFCFPILTVPREIIHGRTIFLQTRYWAFFG